MILCECSRSTSYYQYSGYNIFINTVNQPFQHWPECVKWTTLNENVQDFYKCVAGLNSARPLAPFSPPSLPPPVFFPSFSSLSSFSLLLQTSLVPTPRSDFWEVWAGDVHTSRERRCRRRRVLLGLLRWRHHCLLQTGKRLKNTEKLKLMTIITVIDYCGNNSTCSVTTALS